MNKNQLSQVIAYVDAEYAGIVSRMTDDEKRIRAKHWAQEIGGLSFDAVMAAVRKLSRGPYMPRTAEILSEVELSTGSAAKTAGRSRCRIYRDQNGDEILDLRYSDGSEWVTGYLTNFPEWMQLKFRWMANPNAETAAAWDAYIQTQEKNHALMTMAPNNSAIRIPNSAVPIGGAQ